MTVLSCAFRQCADGTGYAIDAINGQEANPNLIQTAAQAETTYDGPGGTTLG